MKKWFFRIAAGLLLVYTVAGIWLLPYLIRTQAPGIAADATQGGRLFIRSVAFNPFALELSVDGVRFDTPEEAPLFSLRSFQVNLDLLPLLQGKIGIKHVTLTQPQLFIEQDAEGRFNFDWLMHLPKEEAPVEDAGAEEEAGLPALALGRFEITEGAVDYTDLSRSSPLHLKVEPIGLTVQQIDTTLADNPHDRLRFYAGTEGGMLDVRTDIRSLQPPALSGTVDYNAGKLYLTWHFLQEVSTLEVADGRVQIHLAYDVNLSDLNRTQVDDLHVSLERLRIKPKNEGADVLRMKQLQIDGGPIRPLKQSARIERVAVDNLFLALARLDDGSINWQHYFPRSESAEPQAKPTHQSAANASSPDAVIDTVAVTNVNVAFEDRALPQPVTTTVDDLNLTLTGVTSDMTASIPFTNGFTVNRRGRFDFNGTITPDPLRADVDMAITRFALPPFSPYVEAGTYARLADGAVSMTARIAYAPDDAASDMTARGDFHLDSLLVNDTRNAMPLISMTAFEAKDYLFELNPNRLFVDTATLDAFYADVVIDTNKTLNFASIAKPAEKNATQEGNATAEANNSEEGGFPVRIVRFVIRNGAVHFADYSLPLQFDTQVHDVNGQVLGISTVPEDTTYLSIDGVIDMYGAAKAEGSLNTGNPKAFTDIGVKFRNIDLTSFTPYTGKFVGRAIDRGKLSVALRYHIVQSQMKGDNAVVINRIEMGDSVESNESVSLPLDFAIALLEDSDGVIDIDMPVQGNVDNPEFKWGGTVWNAFVNLITKVVTAPFDFIGSMLGMDGDELKFVDFEPGSALLDPPSREKLDALAKVLAKRPKLGLVVTGTYDTAKDGKALRTSALLKEVLSRTDKEKVDASAALAPNLLEPIYVERFGAKAMETLREKIAAEAGDETARQTALKDTLIRELIASQPLGENAIADLASQRARAVGTYLNLQHGIDLGHVRTEPVKPAAQEKEYVPTELGVDAVQ